jgi:cysteinyl-tRNA synthetase
VAHVIRLASGLLDTGAAYQRAGGVYFRGAGVAERAGLDRAGARQLSGEFGGRPDDPAKDDPLDVAVWQAGEPGHPAWDSPWGSGRPGWHAECVAMALSVFGPAMDVHAGGAELRFPHHAYHAAMAEAFTGVRPYARAWFHTGVVTIDGAKMAKSAGNLVLLDELLAKHPAGAVRLMILDRPWGQNWDYRPDLLEAAATRLETLYQAAARNAPNDPAAVAALRRLLADDLNVTAALDLAVEAGGAAAPSPPSSASAETPNRAGPGGEWEHRARPIPRRIDEAHQAGACLRPAGQGRWGSGHRPGRVQRR